MARIYFTKKEATSLSHEVSADIAGNCCTREFERSWANILDRGCHARELCAEPLKKFRFHSEQDDVADLETMILKRKPSHQRLFDKDKSFLDGQKTKTESAEKKTLVTHHCDTQTERAFFSEVGHLCADAGSLDSGNIKKCPEKNGPLRESAHSHLSGKSASFIFR